MHSLQRYVPGWLLQGGGEGGLLKGISVWEVEMKAINVHWAKIQ